MVNPILTQTPQPGDILATSQGDLLSNTTYLKTALARDHNVAYNTNANTDATQGFHNSISFLQGSASPSVPAGANSFFWSRNTDLYWRPSGGSKVQLTNANMGVNAATTGYSFLPGGLAIQWGQGTTPAIGGTAGQILITFPKSFSSAPYSIQCTAQQASGAAPLPTACVASPSVTASQFTIQVSTPGSSSTWRNVPFYWIAIGPK